MNTNFAISGNLPPNITAYASGYTNTYGTPNLLVYDSSTGKLSGKSTATSIAGDGKSATFPFPTSVSGGFPLAQGFYLAGTQTFTDATGHSKTPFESYISIGGNQALSGAFGVDAVDVTYIVTTLCPPSGQAPCKPQTTSTVTPAPLLTEYYASAVNYLGNTMPVGSYPVAVKSYGNALVFDYNDGTVSQSHKGPASAIVANSGSSSVTILNLKNYTTAATISVGAEPTAIALNSAATIAYVPSYGNGTLTAINLSNNTLAGTVTGLTGAQSVAMDPSGSYVWVGGTNSLYKVSVSSLTVVGTFPVSGQVTSLAASNAQNELLYTLVQNCCTSSSSYAVNETSLANMSAKGAYAQATASPYATYTMNGTLPSPAVLPQATVVTAKFSNGMGASATPTGFVVYDLVTHKQIMAGTTATPVRGIASDPASTVAYFTVPDSNQYITVPLPQP